jgi:ABC-type antimicrobial peptide transport system permease subunit
VFGHVKQWSLATDDQQSLRSDLYIACLQMPNDFVAGAPSGSAVIVRARDASAGLLDSILHLNAQMSNQQVIFATQTMDSLISDSLASRRFSMILLVVFAVLALLLASVGIYGVISYAVGQRTNEIGIRMALGAQRLDVLRTVLSDGARMTIVGVAIGVVAALGLTRLMSSMLFGIKPNDPITFGAVAVLLCGIALLACYLPARRAMSVDPMVALRYE